MYLVTDTGTPHRGRANGRQSHLTPFFVDLATPGDIQRPSAPRRARDVFWFTAYQWTPFPRFQDVVPEHRGTYPSRLSRRPCQSG
jgi:hypothetical protein